jgi:hypothetical protein
VRDGIGDEYRSFLDGLAAEAKHRSPVNVVDILRQYIADERQRAQNI